MTEAVYTGLSSLFGSSVTGLAHLAQSVHDILTTPLGSRVMRRGYGSRLPRLLSNPMNAVTLSEIRAAIVSALMLWEPRFEVQHVSAEAIEAGHLSLNIRGRYEGREIALGDILI